MITRVVIEWFNFFLLVVGLVYILRRPLREFLKGKRESIRVLMEKSKEFYEEAQKRHDESRRRLANVDEDAETLKQSMVDTGTYSRDATIEHANIVAKRIHNEVKLAVEQESVRAKAALSRDALERAFESAHKTLRDKISNDDQVRLINDSIKAIQDNKLAQEF